MTDVQIIYGPPGTGKTTELLRLLELELEEGADPARIGYVAFTRKAVQEAVDRLPIPPEDMPWCRTLHSLAYRWHGLRREEVMTDEHYAQFGAEHGYTFSLRGRRDDVTGMLACCDDNPLLNAVHLARQLMIPPGMAAMRLGVKEPTWRIEDLALSLEEYKAREYLWDFDDMLLRLEDGPELDVLFIDEAQDLTPLQWEKARLLMRNCSRVYIAGDDDQAIYEWSGADVRQFVHAEGERRVLGQSHRVPRQVQRLAERAVRRIKDRVPKTWSARAEDGYVELGVDLDSIEPADGTWMFLARTNQQLVVFQEHLKRTGYLYRTAGGTVSCEDDLTAVRAWERLRKGGTVTTGEAQEIYKRMVAGQGYARGGKAALDRLPDDALLGMGDLPGLVAQGPWFEVFTRLGREKLDYLHKCLEHKEREARCYVGTIHSVKGGEADHVVLCPDVPAVVQPHTDAERRVLYVALTRAKKSLFVLHPKHSKHLMIF